MGRACIERKAGETLAEARRNMHRLIAEIQVEVAVRCGVADQVTTWRESFGSPEELTTDERLVLVSTVDEADASQVQKLDAYLSNARSYQELFDERVLIEQPRLSTQRNWQTHIKQIEEYSKSPYPNQITKEIARNYRNYLLARVSHNSARSSISCLKGFWSFGVANGYLNENVWDGLTRKLDQAVKHDLPGDELIRAADQKARDGNDLRYLIMRYTGCRKSDANGLRYCDLEDDFVTFTEWSQEGFVRRLKGGQGDERRVPIHSALQGHVEGLMAQNVGSVTDPVWPKAYKARQQSWGDGWAGSFRDKYGFTSHDLRRLVVTRLAVAGVSPFIINAITRQKIPGMSQVVDLYVRPKPEELRAAIELIN